MSTKPRILVAGATGVIGRSLVPLLIAAGYDVIGTTRDPAKFGMLGELGAQAIVLDALDREAVFSALRTERTAIVIHQLTDLSGRNLAANARIRVEGTRNLVDAAREVGVSRMIAQSISFAYAPGDGPATENDPLNLDTLPAARYCVGRACAGAGRCRDAGGRRPALWHALRTGYLVLIGRCRRRASPSRGAGGDSGVASFLHVGDAARAAILALDWPAGVVNVVERTGSRDRLAAGVCIGSRGPTAADRWRR